MYYILFIFCFTIFHDTILYYTILYVTYLSSMKRAKGLRWYSGSVTMYVPTLATCGPPIASAGHTLGTGLSFTIASAGISTARANAGWLLKAWILVDA